MERYTKAELLQQCKVCSQTQAWHLEHSPRHPFTPEGDDDAASPFGRGDARAVETRRDADPALPADKSSFLAGDLVLRATLIRMGIISQDDINATTRAFAEALSTGKPLTMRPDGSIDASDGPQGAQVNSSEPSASSPGAREGAEQVVPL